MKCSSTPTPTPDRPTWCAARGAAAEPRLAAAASQAPLILINHFPRVATTLAVLPRIPRFSIWCGAPAAPKIWHQRYSRPYAVVYGHLHIRATHYRDGVRFEEVSLGYPQNYNPSRPIALLPPRDPPPALPHPEHS